MAGLINDLARDGTTIGLSTLWAKQGYLNEAAELLIMVLHSPNTPYLYKLLNRPTLTEIKEQLPSQVFAKIEEEARNKKLEDVIDEIRKDSSPAKQFLPLVS